MTHLSQLTMSELREGLREMTASGFAEDAADYRAEIAYRTQDSDHRAPMTMPSGRVLMVRS